MKLTLTLLALTLGFALAQPCAEGFRLFDHEYLATEPVCIPENPQRVLALDMASVELMLFTDKDIVGTAGWLLNELPVMLPELADALAEVTDVGYPANLETVLLAEPDLILAFDDTIDTAAAADIAPVVTPDRALYNDWKLGVQFWSEVLNVQDLYREMEANYDARVAELQEALGESRSELEISVVGASSYGAYLWLEDTPPGNILADVGLGRPESQALSGEAAEARYGDALYVQISDETLDLADGDAIFVFSYATADPETLATETAATEAFRQNPLWQRLSAVRAGRDYYVGGHWWRSQTYLLANKVLDDLFVHLVGRPAETPALEPQE